MLKNLKDLTILYVEDDKLTRNLINKALEHLVKKVYLAQDGIEGLELYKEILPNIVLTDMHMPKMDGLEMSQKIKEMNPQQIIGMFTGDAEELDNKTTQSLNIDTYIVKPLDRQHFFHALEHLGKLALNN